MKFKDTTNTNSNTWRHKNLDYQGLYRPNDDSDEYDYKRKRSSESKSSEDSEDCEDGFTYGVEDKHQDNKFIGWKKFDFKKTN